MDSGKTESKKAAKPEKIGAGQKVEIWAKKDRAKTSVILSLGFEPRIFIVVASALTKRAMIS